MCELVSHTRNLCPRDRRFALQQLRIAVLHCFTDLDESHANGVEDDVVVDAGSLEVVGDRRLDDIGSDGTSATSRSKPAAETSFRSVSRLGSRLED